MMWATPMETPIWITLFNQDVWLDIQNTIITDYKAIVYKLGPTKLQSW